MCNPLYYLLLNLIAEIYYIFYFILIYLSFFSFQCSYFLCLKTPDKQQSTDVTYGYDVIDTGHDVINSKQNVSCFVDPSDSRHAIRNIPRKEDLFNGLFWPLFGIFIGLCFCIIAKICTREKD